MSDDNKFEVNRKGYAKIIVNDPLRAKKITRNENIYTRRLRTMYRYFDDRVLQEIEKILLGQKTEIYDELPNEIISKIDFSFLKKIYFEVYENSIHFLETCINQLPEKQKQIKLEELKFSNVEIGFKTQQMFVIAQKENIKNDFQKILSTRKNELMTFRTSFLFNSRNNFEKFKNKYKEPVFAFAQAKSVTAINNLNRDLSLLQQTKLGVEKCQWNTVGDERVRESHKKLDKHVFAMTNLPKEYNDFNCRCFLIPLFKF